MTGERMVGSEDKGKNKGKKSKGKEKTKDKGEFLFSEMNDQTKAIHDKVLRDEFHLATLPLAHFPGKRSKKGSEEPIYEMTIPIDDRTSVKLISSKAGGGIPEGHDLDYLYALIEILHEQTQFRDDTIYFPVTYLIKKADRKVSQQEITRAIRAVRRYRHLAIQSTAMGFIDDDGKLKFSEEDISYIQHFSIVGDMLKKGRRPQSSGTSGTLDGYCNVVFSKYFMTNIISKELSKPLNYSLMMKISNPKGKKLFRMIDTYRHMESHVGQDNLEIVSKDILNLAKRIPLSPRELSQISLIKRSIDPIHNELKNLSYLSDYFYKTVGNRIEVVYVFSRFTTNQASAYNELTLRGVTAKVAEDLILHRGIAAEKIMDVINYCDYRKDEKKITPGYIVTTIESSDHDWIKQFNSKKREEQKAEGLKDEFRLREKVKMFYELFIQNSIDAHWKALSKEQKDSINRNATDKYQATSTYKHASQKTVDTAIEGIVRETIRKSLNLPTFEKWFEANHEKYAHLSP
jgi:hypothetical protein